MVNEECQYCYPIKHLVLILYSAQNIPENGESFNQKTVIITIPSPYTVHDIGYIGLWCIDFTQDFGHLDIPDLTDVYIPPYVEDQVQ